VLDIIDAILELLEPDPTVVGKDTTAERPFDWAPNTLYVYPVLDIHADGDMGDPPSIRENFTVDAIYVADGQGEEATRTRSRDVSLELDAKAHAYADILAAARFRGPGRPWEDARVTSVDWDRLRQIDVRGVAVRITGWRYKEAA